MGEKRSVRAERFLFTKKVGFFSANPCNFGVGVV